MFTLAIWCLHDGICPSSRLWPGWRALMATSCRSLTLAVMRPRSSTVPCDLAHSRTAVARRLDMLEDVTLLALSRARGNAQDHEHDQWLGQAQTARTARILELRTTAGWIAAVGEYYQPRARTTRDTYIGVFLAVAGTIGIISAFLWTPA